MEYEPDDIYGFKGGEDKILAPKGILKTDKWRDADGDEGKARLAGEYLSALRQKYLEEMPNDKSKALDLWNRDAEYVWDNTGSGFWGTAGEVLAGAARSLVYGTAATGLTAVHGALSVGNRMLSAPARAVEELSGRDIGARRAFEHNQREIDAMIPEGRVFDEKAGQLVRWVGRGFDEREISAKEFNEVKSNSKFFRNGKYYRDFKLDHEDDFNALLSAADVYAADGSKENYEALRAAERQAFASAAAFNKDDEKGYENRSFAVNENTRNLLRLYTQTRDPQARSALTAIYGTGIADTRAREAIDAVQKRILDRWGDNFFGREMATFVEYADPSEAVATAATLGVGKVAKSAYAGLMSAKAAKGVAAKGASMFAPWAKAAGKIGGAIGLEAAEEAATEYWQTGIENPFASDEEKREAAGMAAAQAVLMGGVGAAYGAKQASKARRLQGRLAEVAKDGTVSVPESTPLGGVFVAENGAVYRNVDGVARPLTEAELAEILNQSGEANGAAGAPAPLGYENAPVVEMPLDKLTLSKDVPNFKEGADENGVVGGQRLQGKYERVGTAPIVVWERENGSMEVITGRHRLDLAKRSGEKSIPAYVVREADGFTVDDARTFDAESNIRDGMGSVRDYAHFFRNKDIAEEEASNKGLLSREKGKRGWAIGKLAVDDLYWLYRNGGISEERAAAIARGAPNDADVQKAAIASAKGMDATTLEIHTRRLKAFKEENGGGVEAGEGAQQGDLFGVDDAAMQEMVALSKAAGELVKQNKQKILAVKGVIKRPEIAREMGVDINNPEAVKAAVAALEYENSRLMSPTPEPEIMEKIRRKAGLFGKAENGKNVEQGAGVETQEDTGGLFDDGTAEMSFRRAVKKNPTVLEKLVSAKPISVAADAYKGHYELNAQSAFRYVMDKLRGREYTNLDTGEKIEIGQVGARKIASHDRHDEAYLRSFISIPDIIENGIFLGEEANAKGNGKYDKYRYYACGLKIGNEDYTVRFTVGELNGSWFYDQAFTKIEKGDLIRKVPTLSKRAFPSGSPYGFVDKRLISLLQEKNAENEKNLSKGAKGEAKTREEIVDEVVNMPAAEIEPHEPLDKAEIKSVFRGFGEVQNERDGRVVVFSTGCAGKIRRHKGFDSSTVIKNFKNLFKTAIPAISEDEVLKEGHKAHGNIESVEHYVNKFSVNGVEYFIRFTVPVIHNNKGAANVHSSAISEVSIYKKGDSTLYPLNTAGSSSPSFIDGKLLDFFNSVNKKSLEKAKSGDVALSKAADSSAEGKPVGEGQGVHRAQASVAKLAKEEYSRLKDVRDGVVGKKPFTFVRAVSAMRSALPKSVRFNKALNRLEGVPSIGDIRRYMERVFNVPISKGLRKDLKMKGALGVYYQRLQAIRTLRGHHNDLDVVAHELGHYLDTLFFGGELGGEEIRNSGMRFVRELEDYCIERFGEGAYNASQWASEGWAQFISDVIRGNKAVAERCPTAFEVLNEALNDNPRVNEAFGLIREMAELNGNASPLERANANVRRKSDAVHRTFVDRFIESVHWFNRMWFDEYEALERLQKDLDASGIGGEEGARVIDLARNYAGGSVGQVNYSLTVAQIDLDGNVIGKSLRAILRDNLKTVYDKENIDAYLMARRAVAYYQRKENVFDKGGCKYKFGIDYADAVDVVSMASEGMRSCAAELDVYMRNDLKMLRQSGVISGEVYSKCLQNIGYSPLQRYMEAIGDAETGGSGGGFANVASALRGFKGSDREVISPLDSIAANSRRFREMALKNRVASRVITGIHGGVGLGKWASPAPDRTQAIKLQVREYAEAILAYKEKVKIELPSHGRARDNKISAIERELKADPMLACVIFRDEAKSDAANQIITVWRDGGKVAWQVYDRGLYQALAGMDNTAAWFWETWLGQLFSGSARVLRAGATSALQFTVGNLARDIQAATVFSNNGYVPIFSALRHGAIPAAIGSVRRVGEALGRDTSRWFRDSFLAENAKLYDEWVAAGGSMATFAENGVQTPEEISVDEMLQRRSLAREWFEKFKHAPIKRTAEVLATPFEGFSKFSEEVNRLAEFGLARKKALKELRKEGLTAAEAREVWSGEKGSAMRRKAANDSKEITLNFSRGGRYGKQVNMVVAFFNAGMQGVYKYVSDLNPVDWVRLCVALRDANVSEMRESVKGRNAVKLAKVVAISAIAAALRAAMYMELDDDDKRRLDNLPDWRKRTYWTFMFGGVMYQIPKAQELTPFCAVFDKAAKAAYGIEPDAESDVLPTAWDILSPSLVPQVAKPFIEISTNRNLFTGAELIPFYIQQNGLPSSQELPSTSSTSKWIARNLAERGVEVSPIHLDWAVNTVFSSLGRWVVKNITDRAAESAGGLPSAPEGMRSLAGFTGMDKFVVPEYSAGKYVSKFYDMKRDWAQLKGTVRKIEDGKLPPRMFTPAQIRLAEWYEGCRDGVAMSREKEMNQVVKLISEMNAAIAAAKSSTELTPRQKRDVILFNKRKIDNLAEMAYKELCFSEDKYGRWKREAQ